VLRGRVGRQRILELYRRADAVFSAPGGYLHDNYPISARLDGLEIALDLQKPVFLLGHSIGPFRKARSIRRCPTILNRAARIVVRERFSLDHLRDCGVRCDHVSLAADLAFAVAARKPDLFQSRAGPIRRIGLCLRRWPLRDIWGTRRMRDKGIEFCSWLMRDPSIELVFVSTCQGVPGYIDDSRIALEIVAALPPSLRSRCIVARERRAPEALIRFFHGLDACISMRMHGCILAMLAGTPAMALDYELKSIGMYEMMGLENYHVDFRADVARWKLTAERFLTEINAIRLGLHDRVVAMGNSAYAAVVDSARELLRA
jgi:colanic acid/amylovoran biosynthesis protein